MDIDEDPTRPEGEEGEADATALGNPDALSDSELPNAQDYTDEFPPPLKLVDVKGKGREEPTHAHECPLLPFVSGVWHFQLMHFMFGFAVDNLPWVEKYRPVTLDDVVSHKDIVSTIDKFIGLNRLPHLLFYGPPGTGKTSTILAVARKLYAHTKAGMRNNVLELNASDDRGIDTVREEIKNFASTKMVFAAKEGFKLIILDEADMMTTAAQGALRRVIEQYTQNVRFCIICNYVNRIIPAIQSRCTKFRFGPLEITEVERRLNHVIEAEKANVTPDGKAALLKLSKGDMRRALNVLQACHAAYEVTDESAVYNCTGNPHPTDVEDIVKSMMNEEFEVAFRRISAIKVDKGLALQDIISGIYEYVQSIELPTQSRVYLLDHLAQVEHRLSTGGSEKLQLTAVLGTVKGAVQLATKSEAYKPPKKKA